MVEAGYLYLTLFICSALFTVRDLLIQSEPEAKVIPVTRMGLSTYVGPTLKFQYCSACGYQKAYQNYGNILREAYPEITVEGVHYSPPGYMTFLARTLGFGKLLIIVCIMSGVNIFGSIGCVEPSWWKWCVENKIYSCVLMFYMCNALEGHLLATGAFEIYFNDVPVWSKLETGRMPQPLELVQIIDNHLQFQTKVELKPGFAK